MSNGGIVALTTHICLNGLGATLNVPSTIISSTSPAFRAFKQCSLEYAKYLAISMYGNWDGQRSLTDHVVISYAWALICKPKIVIFNNILKLLISSLELILKYQ